MKLTQPHDDHFDVVIAGSGFAGTFFLAKLLEKSRPDLRVVVLERGRVNDHAWQVDHLKPSDMEAESTYTRAGSEDFQWAFTLGFGGGSNCWIGNTPRCMPSDFNLRSTYGVGRDWPISYDDLEPYLGEAEAMMQVSGPEGTRPWPQTRPYPLPPHRVSRADEIMMQAYPGLHIPAPTARPSVATASRPACCANGVCTTCPINSKFSILNSLMSPFEDPRVEVALGAEVLTVDMQGGRARGVTFRQEGQERRLSADLVVLAANALFNPFILMRSGFDDAALGRYLHAQLSFHGEIFLDGIDHFGGSSLLTSLNYTQYDGAFRRDRGSMLLEFWNKGRMRAEHGRWRQVIPFFAKVEELPAPENRVVASPDNSAKPIAEFHGYSDYALATFNNARSLIEGIVSPLPVERIVVDSRHFFSTHIHGTTVMGDDPADSVVDADLVHHKVRNLVLLGAGAFPSASQANPTLILSALALRTADRITAPGASPS
jgi:choline dehydrogenase-like flavoprotein